MANDARGDPGAERALACEHVLDGVAAELEDEAVQPASADSSRCQKQRTDEEERGYGTSIRRFTRLSTLAKEGQKRRGPAAAEAEAVRTLWTP